MTDHSTSDTEYGTVPPDEQLSILESEGVLTDDRAEEARLTLDFEKTRGVYHDSYADIDDADYHRAVADVFGIPLEEVPERLAALEVSREQFITLLSLNAFLDGEYPLVDRARMAMRIVDLSPASSVPAKMSTLTDDTYEQTLTDHGQAVVFVWKRFCPPCLELKEHLDEVYDVLPDDVAVGGVDGERAPEFCREYDVEAAPSVMLFAGGELAETLRGYHAPSAIEDAVQSVFGD